LDVVSDLAVPGDRRQVAAGSGHGARRAHADVGRRSESALYAASVRRRHAALSPGTQFWTPTFGRLSVGPLRVARWVDHYHQPLRHAPPSPVLGKSRGLRSGALETGDRGAAAEDGVLALRRRAARLHRRALRLAGRRARHRDAGTALEFLARGGSSSRAA